MKRYVRTGAVLLACLLVLGTASLTLAQGRGDGGGRGNGRGGSSGGGGGSAGGGPANAVLYGDLYVIERDGNGIPITKSFTIVGERETTTAVCVQPIDASCVLLPLKGDDPAFNPEVDDACDVQAAYVDRLQEVSFGRQSVARASSTVIDKAYYEALSSLNAAATSGAPVPYALDPAGRVVLALPDEDTGTLIQKTIDAPLENFGLYRALMTAGCLGTVTIEREPGVPLTMQLSAEATARLTAAGFGHLVCTATGEPIGDLDMFRAAAFYAAAADKTDPISIDEVVNINTYLGINTVTTGTTGRARREVAITWREFEIGGSPYRYDRNVTHPPLPATPGGRVLPGDALVLKDISLSGFPATLFEAGSVALFEASPPGVDLPAVNVQVCRGGLPYKDTTGAPSHCTAQTDRGGQCGGANWFTQTAEDARKIIWYLHNWGVPEIGY